MTLNKDSLTDQQFSKFTAAGSRKLAIWNFLFLVSSDSLIYKTRTLPDKQPWENNLENNLAKTTSRKPRGYLQRQTTTCTNFLETKYRNTTLANRYPKNTAHNGIVSQHCKTDGALTKLYENGEGGGFYSCSSYNETRVIQALPSSRPTTTQDL